MLLEGLSVSWSSLKRALFVFFKLSLNSINEQDLIDLFLIDKKLIQMGDKFFKKIERSLKQFGTLWYSQMRSKAGLIRK